MSYPVLEVYNKTHLLIKTPLAQAIADAVEGCYLSDVLGDGVRLCVRWDLETTQKVADWRVPTLSPMLRDYDFVGRFEPYVHQLKMCSFLSLNRKGFCLADMGTGKTASVVWTLDYLFKTNRIKRVLVIGVLSNMKSTWEDEFFGINPQYQVRVLHGDSKKRALMAQMDDHVHIINHDGVETIQKELLANNYDVVVLDELTAFKNSKAERFKQVKPLCDKARYVWGLTGTPTPNRPDEAYGQIKIVRPDNLQGVSAYRFKERVMLKTSAFTWIPRFDASETVFQFMQPAIKIDKAEVLALPKVSHEYIKVALTDEQKRFYKEMKDHKFVGVEDVTFTALNGGALMNKLLQVATGAIYDDEGVSRMFDISPRIEMTIELIKQERAKVSDRCKGKTIVFAPFRHTIQILNNVLSKHFSVAVITGDTSSNQRAEIFSQFQNTSEPEVLLAVPRTMSHGVTATAASCIVWFGPVTSNEVYQQACNRIDRPGQTQEMTIYHLSGTAVEEKLYKTLRDRKLSQSELLDLYTDFVRDF